MWLAKNIRKPGDKLPTSKTVGAFYTRIFAALLFLIGVLSCVSAQVSTSNFQQSTTPRRVHGNGEPTHADILRGAYGPYRSNNDLLYYHLDLRVDPEKKYISGKNTIRFKLLTDGTGIQRNVLPTFQIRNVLLDEAAPKTTALQDQGAAGRTLFIDFPNTLKRGKTYTIEFYYSGNPVEMG